MNADGREGFFESSQMGSVVKKSILWNQEQKEHVFDAIIRRKLLKRGQEELPQLLAAAVSPALNMDHEEVQVESILFLAYAIAKHVTMHIKIPATKIRTFYPGFSWLTGFRQAWQWV